MFATTPYEYRSYLATTFAEPEVREPETRVPLLIASYKSHTRPQHGRSLENAESGDEALENLNVDAPAIRAGFPRHIIGTSVACI